MTELLLKTKPFLVNTLTATITGNTLSHLGRYSSVHRRLSSTPRLFYKFHIIEQALQSYNLESYPLHVYRGCRWFFVRCESIVFTLFTCEDCVCNNLFFMDNLLVWVATSLVLHLFNENQFSYVSQC